jgi:hypothetical protein
VKKDVDIVSGGKKEGSHLSIKNALRHASGVKEVSSHLSIKWSSLYSSIEKYAENQMT